MSIQATPVYHFTAAQEWTWPDITWSGTGLKRRVARYGQTWYAEYAFWDATTGLVFAVGQGGVTADFYLISPGLAGTNGATTSGGAGGGAGAPFTWSGISLPTGSYTVVISTATTSVTGNGVSLAATTPAGGVASGTAYRLYGDAEHQYGSAGSRGSGGAIVPGQGAVGCNFLPARAPSTAYGVSASNGGTLIGALGVGAGGNGGAATNYLGGNAPNMAAPGAGTVGMALMRVVMPGGSQ